MGMESKELCVAGVGIRQDEEGRYSLNDLHAAAGGEQKNRPKYWIENLQTQALVAEIEKGGIPPIVAKQGLGTFVTRDLVYAYAMWISPSFQLKVIRAYDELVNQPVNPSRLSRLQLIELALIAEQERIALEEKVQVLEPKAAALERIAEAEGNMNITQAAKTLQMPPKRLFAWLSVNGWIYRRPGGREWCAYQSRIVAGYMEHKVIEIGSAEEPKIATQAMVTPKGLTRLGELLNVELQAA